MKLCPICKNTYPDDYQICPRDQSPLTMLGAEIVPGMVLRGKYEVLRQLGAGGMATVYQVRHRAFHELAAIKVVHAQLMHDPDFLKRFRNEAVVARQLKHPNAVRVEDFDSTEDGRPFIVMEFVDGHSLDQVRRLAPGPWPVARCVNIVSQAAEALGAAHALGIVHRDIKPANIILLGGDNDQVHVKVLDFGIAKVDSAFTGMTAVLTEQGLVVGTPQYMSPEQASGGVDAGIDGRSDLYSLGLVLYEMLTGAPPFKADSPMSMLMHQLNSVPAPPESVSAVPPAISALVLKALRKAPGERFQSAAEMLAALRDPQAWYAPSSPSPKASAKAKAAISVAASPAPPAEAHKPELVDDAGVGQVHGSASAFIRKNLYVIASSVGLILLAAVAATLFSFANKHPKQTMSEQPRAIGNQSSPQEVESQPIAASPSLPRPTQSTPSNIPQVQEVIPKKLKVEPAPKETPEAMYAKALQLTKEKLHAQAVPLLKSACYGGSAASCRDLGQTYEIGWNVRGDKARAVVLYRKACDGGDMVGCTHLGNTYDINDAQAIVFYRKACNGSDAWGCRNLGSRYDGGYGIAQDKTQAAIFYRKACDGDDSYGCDALGHLYEKGTGVAQDVAQAITLYQKACKTGWLPACDYLKKTNP